MARRILLVALAVCVSSWALSAAERATFILTDGQRVSGTLDPRGDSSGAELRLVGGGTRRQTFNVDEVAVIDFSGGSPGANELAALPRRGHMLPMRNGRMQVGSLVNVVNGDTVVWREEGGAQRNIPVRQIARVYLNPNNARDTFKYSGTRRSTG